MRNLTFTGPRYAGAMETKELSPLALAAVVLIVPGGTLIAAAVLARRWRKRVNADR